VDISRGDKVQVILGAIGPFWAKWGLKRVSRSASFFSCGKPDDLSASLQRLISTKFGHETYRRGIRKDMFENLHFRDHLPLKSEIENRSNRHLTQSRQQVMGCTAERYCLLRVVVQGPGSFRGWPTFLYDVRLRSYGASKLPNFRILAYFSHTKPPKTYLPVISLQPRGYIAE